ncbi:hypothetical protein C0991_000715 [Blastosporella zonata]|nr:hypothetical protein C0991_000715 [Blastosporella zonata]
MNVTREFVGAADSWSGTTALNSVHITDHSDQKCTLHILLAVEHDEPTSPISSRSANTVKMSDSFADLWNSSAPTKPAPQKLGSAPANNVPKRAQHDVFSMLSSAGSSNSSSRSMSPAVSGVSSQRTAPTPATKPLSSGGDAFSGLLSGSLAAGANGNTRQTMAERAAEAERQKLESLRRHQQSVKPPTPSAWDGLDSLAKPVAQSAPSLVPKHGNALLNDDWGLDSFVSQRAPVTKPSPPPPVPAASAADDDDWLGDFAHKPVSQPKPQAFGTSRQKLREDDSSPPPLPARRRADSPGDFDFGNREDALLGDDSNDEDDILGALSKPVEAIPKRRSPPAAIRETPSSMQSSSRTNGRTATPSSRPVSPPPHILGQIVEMGFSVQQARVALAATDTGLDVEAALETLLSNGAASDGPAQPSPQSPDFHPAAPRSASRLMAPDRQRQTPSPGTGPSQQDRERDIREQADKLIAQASEIGLSVFSKASSFWKEGKERVQKAYVERAVPTAGTSSTPNNTGRPKWMTDQTHGGEDEDPWKDGLREPGGGFSDEVKSKSERAKPQPQQQRIPPEPKPKPTTADLFSDDAEPAAYVSPFRRRTPAAAAAPSPASTSRATPPPPRAPSPIRPRPNLVSASSTALATATKHKDAGSAKFKLGQYAEAEAAYTSGIAALPSGHLLLVPLHNNRALARLRTGDHTGAGTDAGVVVELVGAGYHPQREAKVDREDEGAGVDLGDALVKAVKRRAEAWEGREKWEEAGKDWGMLAGLEWAGPKARGEAASAVGRCRKLVSQNKEAEAGEAAPKPKPKPKPKPPVKPAALSRPAPPSQALENLRTASNAADAEDQLRHELKDSVDAKLLAWKSGKETNIRALLGSLDLVLWQELGLQKVGMAELVSPSQVKIKYTRTIAKLHPDKLNSGNTTVEQRMLANGVFGALNEAWNAFKN